MSFCKIYLRSQRPDVSSEDLKKYANSYIIVDNGDVSLVYYITTDGILFDCGINVELKKLLKIEEVSRLSLDREPIELNKEQRILFEKSITSNGGHIFPTYLDDPRVPERLGQVSQALIAQSFRNETNIPINFLAGGNDLCSFLLRTTIPPQGQLIIIRPLIHCMAMYIWQDGNKFKCFWFDSETWLSKYPPNCIIAEALNAVYPGIEIFVNKTQVQHTHNGCYNYSFEVVQRIMKNSSELRKITPTTQAEIAYIDKATVYTIDPPTIINGLVDLDLSKSDQFLRQIVSNQIALLVKKPRDVIIEIGKAREETQGLPLLEQPQPLPNGVQHNLYTIKITQDETKAAYLTVSFPDQNHLLYSGLLTYSKKARYPHELRDDKEHKALENIFATQIHEQTATSITYRFTSLAQMDIDLTRFKDKIAPSLFAEGLTQSLALGTFIEDAQEELTCAKVKINDDGGLDLWQVRDALRYLAQDAFILPCVKGQEINDLLPLSFMQLPTWVFIPYATIPAGKIAHQILIAINTKQKMVIIYNSREISNLKEIEKIIKPNLPESMQSYTFQSGQELIPYSLQYDNWSCGVHVVAAACYLLESEDKKKEISLTKMSLDTEKWLHKIIRAENNQQKIDLKLKLGEENQQNRAIKSNLLNSLVELILQDYPQPLKSQLQTLERALQIEVWGNLDRRENNTGRQQTQHDLIQERSLGSFKNYYMQQHPNDNDVDRLLKILGVLNLKADPSVITKDFVAKLFLFLKHYPYSLNILFLTPMAERVKFINEQSQKDLCNKIDANQQKFDQQQQYLEKQKIKNERVYNFLDIQETIRLDLENEDDNLLQRYIASRDKLEDLEAFIRKQENSEIFANTIGMLDRPNEFNQPMVLFAVRNHLEFIEPETKNVSTKTPGNEGFSYDVIQEYAQTVEQTRTISEKLAEFCPEIDENTATTNVSLTSWLTKQKNHEFTDFVEHNQANAQILIKILGLLCDNDRLKYNPPNNPEIIKSFFTLLATLGVSDLTQSDHPTFAINNIISQILKHDGGPELLFTLFNLSNAVLNRDTFIKYYNYGYRNFSGCIFYGDFSGLDFTGLDLSKANLNYVNLTGANLSATNLHKASMYHAILSEATLCNTDLSGANLSYATLSGANLSNADVSRVRFNHALLLHANLYNTQRSGTDFSDANLSYANLSKDPPIDLPIKKTPHYGAMLLCAPPGPQTNFTNAIMIQANFTNADLIDTNFTNADLTQATILEAVFSDKDLPDESERNSLSGVKLSGAILDNNALKYFSARGAKDLPSSPIDRVKPHIDQNPSAFFPRKERVRTTERCQSLGFDN